MSDSIASAAQVITALDKLMNSWRTVITLLFTPLFFVLGQKVNLFTDIPEYVLALGALGAGAGVSMCLQLLTKSFSVGLKHTSYKLKQSQLTYDQYAILKMCLTVDQPWYHTGRRGEAGALGDEIQRFLESNLGYMDGRTFRIESAYWKWINKRRREIINKEVPPDVEQKHQERARRANYEDSRRII